MAFKADDQILADGTGITIPNFTTNTRPESPVDGQIIYNTDTGVMEIYDGGLWKDVTSTAKGGANPFLYRQIITTGYVMGGYQSSSPWKNVNRMNHSTDVCTNLGDLLSHSAAYTSGACNLTKGFLWSADNTWPGSSAQTTAFSMATETTLTQDPVWNMHVGRNDSATLQKEWYYAWILGGGSTTIDEFNLTTETMLGSSVGTSMAGDNQQSGAASISDETKGFAWGNATHKYDYSTSTLTVNTTGTVNGSGSQQKGISSKLSRGYCGNEGTYNGGYNLRRWNLTTETNLGTTPKPIGNSGEENLDMGQDHQYMMGMYDTAQNNRGWKFSYDTETGIELGAGSVRTGVAGGSSGHCVWKG